MLAMAEILKNRTISQGSLEKLAIKMVCACDNYSDLKL